ncbi:MAG: D-glycero-alpha-D-manno-heptose-7-phosphate kinase [Blastocatellia bacterium]|nr:D-glycero-alpha-D-manno-heptose-7-phosphate kinase [Blastocatellia bacterium]
MIIESSAPTRVDLAGGTVDIWPLYLFHPGAMTVNFALSLRAHVRIETRDDDRVILESRDRAIKFETRLDRIDELASEERLELVSKMVNFFRPETGFHLVAHSEAPAGAGISGSSALAIALIGALNTLVGRRYEERQFIGLAANVETTVIKVPAGLQDYYPAFYGSTSCIHLDPDGVDREHLAIDNDEVKRRFVICYTGEPRHSGINNWEVFKRHIDGDQAVFSIFERIRDAAVSMRAALLANDWNAVAETMRAAYPNRKRLAPGITTPHMDHLVELALANGAEAAKVCGAGGGGCIAFLCGEGRKPDLERALTEAGAEILDWEVSREGLIVKGS